MPIPQLLADALARDPARPFLTFYDHASGERVELSRATTANWVAKTANMLQDSLGAENGSRVSVSLPVHWQRAVWLLAAWDVGCLVDPSGGTEPAPDVAVVGPSVLEDGPPPADEVVALSLRPLGGRFTESLPPGVVDYNAEVLGHGDVFSPYDPPGSSTPALVDDDGSVLDHGACVDAAHRARDRWDGRPSVRLLTDGDADPSTSATTLLGPLAGDGSVVLVANPDHARLEALIADEHVTAVDLPGWSR